MKYSHTERTTAHSRKKSAYFHAIYFLVLSSLAGLGVFMFFIFNGNPDYQLMTAVGLSSLYFLWGCYYHSVLGDFHPKIMVEYLLIAIMAVILVRGVIIR